MRKYKNQLQPFLFALLVIANSYCSDSNTIDNGNSKDDTVTPQLTPGPPSSRLTELETQLEAVKNSIIINEKKCYSLIGNATMATRTALNPDLSPEDKEVAEERAQFARDAVKKCEAEKDAEKEELEEKQAGIEAEIRSLKGP